MYPKPHLLAWLYTRSLPATLVALPVAVAFVLLWPEPLGPRMPWVWLFICVHALAVVALTQRTATGGAGFLYTRGFSRDALWVHLLLAEGLAVLCVWLPAALLVWTPVRSVVQDRWLANPWFPVMRASELAVPWGWLAGYVLLLAVFAYAQVRRWQPTRERAAGTLLAAGTVAVGLTLVAEGFHTEWYGYLTWTALAVAALAMLVGAWRLHRRLEVHA
ncbi:MAG: hypothetical protein WDZ31_04915 [Phycisphaeraceae bacterium]